MVAFGTFAAPTILAVVVAVCFQVGYILIFGGAKSESNVTDSFIALEDRLKQLETETFSMNGAEELEATIHELEMKIKQIETLLDALQMTRKNDESLETNQNQADVKRNSRAYHTARDSVVYLILTGISALQIGLVTSVFILFRIIKSKTKMNNTITDSTPEDERDSSNLHVNDIADTECNDKTDESHNNNK